MNPRQYKEPGTSNSLDKASECCMFSCPMRQREQNS